MFKSVLFVLMFWNLILFSDDSVPIQGYGEMDKEACDFARKENKKEVWKHYIKKFPQGICVFEAETKIEGFSETSNANADNSQKASENIEIICIDGKSCFESAEKITNSKHMITEESLILFKKSCEFEYGDGCYRVGDYLLNSEKKPEEAFKLFDKACFLSSGKGCHQKAILIYKKDPVQAEKIFANNCKMNFASGCVAQGVLNEEKHSDLALTLYEKACGMNHGGGCFLQGKNEKDVYKKKDLFWKACNLNDNLGCVEKAKFLAMGNAVEKDKKEAIEIYEKIKEKDEDLACSLKPYLGMKMTPEEINNYAENSIAYIFIKTKGGDFTGSGFIINKQNDVVTNRHVVDGAIEGKVKFKNGIYKITGVIWEDETNDIMIVSTDAPYGRYEPLKFAEKLPKVGETLVAIGNPVGEERTLTKGVVSAIRYGKDNQSFFLPKYEEMIQTDTPISHGSSGGPLFNETGEVIGLSTLMRNNAQNINFVVSYNLITRLLSTKPLNMNLAEKEKLRLEKMKKRSDFYFQQGLSEYKQKKYENSIPFFIKSLIIDEENIKVYRAVASAYLLLYKDSDVIFWATKGLSKNKEDYLLWYYFGASSGYLGKKDDVKLAIKALKELRPEYAQALENKFIKKSLIQRAIDAWDTFLE